MLLLDVSLSFGAILPYFDDFFTNRKFGSSLAKGTTPFARDFFDLQRVLPLTCGNLPKRKKNLKNEKIRVVQIFSWE